MPPRSWTVRQLLGARYDRVIQGPVYNVLWQGGARSVEPWFHIGSVGESDIDSVAEYTASLNDLLKTTRWVLAAIGANPMGFMFQQPITHDTLGLHVQFFHNHPDVVLGNFPQGSYQAIQRTDDNAFAIPAVRSRSMRVPPPFDVLRCAAQMAAAHLSRGNGRQWSGSGLARYNG